MSNIHKIQENFFQYIINNSSNLDFIKSNNAIDRLDIYKATININLTNALKITYPGIWKLVGEECATNIAALFCQQHQYLPHTGCLDDFGKEFSIFLSTIPELSSLPYLSDYAHYEWLNHLSYLAQDQTEISEEYLAKIPEEDLPNSVFIFKESCHLFSSQHDIKQVHDILYNNINNVTLSNNYTYGLICRNDGEIKIIWLNKEDFIFLDKLKSGLTLLEVISYLENENIAFNLTMLIKFLLINKIIVELSINKEL
jgi:hypothetical protein